MYLAPGLCSDRLSPHPQVCPIGRGAAHYKEEARSYIRSPIVSWMKDPSELSWGEMLAIFVLLTLGAGFVAMVAGMPYFWLIWVLGFAVVLPILGILSPEDEVDNEPVEDERGADVSTDPLASLRDQYARGDLTDEEFERLC